MADTEMHEKIDRLLHDAEHALSGERMALMMVGRIPTAAEDARKLRDRYHALMNEARSLDPKETAPAWSEADV